MRYRVSSSAGREHFARYGDAQRRAIEIVRTNAARFVTIAMYAEAIGWHAFERWHWGERGARVEEADGREEVSPPSYE